MSLKQHKFCEISSRYCVDKFGRIYRREIAIQGYDEVKTIDCCKLVSVESGLEMWPAVFIPAQFHVLT